MFHAQTLPQRIFACTDDPNFRLAPLTVEGYVTRRRDCAPLRDVRVYFWQSNSLGVNTADCRGFVLSDANGAFQVRVTPTTAHNDTVRVTHGRPIQGHRRGGASKNDPKKEHISAENLLEFVLIRTLPVFLMARTANQHCVELSSLFVVRIRKLS